MKNTSTFKRIVDAVAAYRWMSDRKSIEAAHEKLSKALDGTGSSQAVRSARESLLTALENRWTAEQEQQRLIGPEHAAVLDRIGQIDNEIDDLLDELKQVLEGT
ncbi:hypothetical protein HB777_29290 [Mesorhizobium loti]|nr:hypothetical protein HB777_29290 [Mesorhizobium loti]